MLAFGGAGDAAASEAAGADETAAVEARIECVLFCSTRIYDGAKICSDSSTKEISK